jgi:GNAT superfamily N-acetyltransferase
MLEVAPCRADDVREAPNFADLVEEYGGEVAIRELPWPQVDWKTYYQLEQAGALHVLGARLDGLLIGFVVLVTSMSAEYGVPLCCTEAFFVARAWRHTGAGLLLLAAAEAKTRQLGARGLAVNAPLGGRLADLLPKCGFREVGRMFFKPIHAGKACDA